MESNKDLEDFRKQWKRELNRDKFSVDGKSSPQNSSNLKQNASNLDCDTDKTKDVQHALFSVEELIRYVVVSSSNFMCSNFSRSLMYSQMNQRQV